MSVLIGETDHACPSSECARQDRLDREMLERQDRLDRAVKRWWQFWRRVNA